MRTQRMRLRRQTRAAATAFAMLLSASALAGMSTTAHAEPTDPTSTYAPGVAEGESSATVDFNDDLEAAATKIRALAGGDEIQGFSTDLDAGVLTVLWKAPLPEAAKSLDRTQIGGLEIRVQEAAFSEEELVAVSDRLLEASLAGTVGPITSVTGSVDGSTLVVEVPGDVQRADLTDLGHEITSMTGLKAVVRAGETPTSVSRQNDSAPWYGGGMMRHDRVICSTGFPVVTPAGAGRLLSARHCDASGNWAWNDGASDQLTPGGAAVSVRAAEDTMLIDPNGGTGGKVHGGPWNAGSGHARYQLKVGGAGRAVHQQSVCTSGANSGEHCGLRIQDTSIRTYNCNGGICHGFTARQPGPGPYSVAVVGGDSGGPVYYNRADGRVGARGTITDGSGVCSSTPPMRFAQACFNTVWFADIEILENDWNVTVETTP